MFFRLVVFLFIVTFSLSVNSQERSAAFSEFLKTEIVKSYEGMSKTQYANLISALGSIAGFAVQQGLREDLVVRQKIPSRKIFRVIEIKSGERYYFGDFINTLLFESEDSLNLWYVLTSTYTGDKAKLPNIDTMAKMNAQRIGSKEFGAHDVGESYMPSEPTIGLLKKHWPNTYKKLKKEKLHPLSWGWQIASFVKSDLLGKNKPIPENIAIQIFMESAISMSKYELKGSKKNNKLLKREAQPPFRFAHRLRLFYGLNYTPG